MPPTTEHEMWLDLFTNNPRLAPDLLSETFGMPVPSYDEASVESPGIVLRYRGRPVLACVVEVQRDHDPRRRLTWAENVTAAYARHDCQTILLVMWPHAHGAEHLATPIVLGPSSVVTPHVIGMSALPLVTDEEQAIANPELATLSALAHADGPRGKEVLAAVSAGVLSLGKAAGEKEENAKMYADYLSEALSRTASELWRTMMGVAKYEYKSEWARRYVAEGRAEGKAQGEAEAVLFILESRDFEVSDQLRERILACTDPAVTRKWLERAFTVATPEELVQWD
ncbi:hypothetical protein [Herbidospora cretacea]|uniref:hypothetical protein n=1 Tax=Herbidospora cretacea TaxID=28444 RepID=UPI00077493F3|nr:hypothetical protein [Herbidospora cretacea]